MKAKNNEIYILRDCEGKVDIDEYFEEEDIPKLKEFLKSLGVKNVYVEDDKESIEKKKPFRYEKPSLQKRVQREVDWENHKVIEIVLLSRANDKIILREIVRISGKGSQCRYKLPSFFKILCNSINLIVIITK